MKKLLPILLTVLAINTFAQDLIITEISYNPPESGTDSTEYIEIYNNSSSPIDLSGYQITSGVIHTFYNGEIIAAGDYYVIAVDSIAVFNTFGVLPNAQWTSGGLSNGGEAIAIHDGLGNLVDTVDYDDASPWTTTPDGNGPSLVLCDVLSDNNDGANWFESQTSASIVINGNTVYGSPGSDDAACAASSLDTIATIATADMSVLENVGTVDVTIELNQAAVNNHTVDLVLTSGNAAVVGNYTTQTVTFTGGSTSEVVTITITQGQLSSSSETFDFSLSNASADLVLGSDTDFQLTVNQMPSNPAACSDLFFSEYIESSGTKVLEIYNPTMQAIDLSAYQIRRYTNGASIATATYSPIYTLIPGEVYVICNSSADPAVQAEANDYSSFINFNGDDAIELFNTITGSSVDIIGEIGVDPGTSWHVGTDSTENVTMVRKSNIDGGNLTWIGGADQEWDTYGLNEYSYIGSHTNTCPLPPNPVAFPKGDLGYCSGDTVLLVSHSFGGTMPYTYDWAVGGTSVSTNDTLMYETTTSGTLSITLTITDDNNLVDDTTFNVLVRSNPTAGFTLSPNTSICAEDTSWITSTGPGPGIYTYTYTSNPTATINISGALGDGYFTTTTSGTYEITQTLTDSYGCYDTAMQSIVVNLDDASFSLLPDVCDDESLSLVHSNTSGTWSGTGVTDGGNGMGDFSSSTLGTHYITYTTNGVCPDAYTDTIEVLASPTADFTYSGSLTVDFVDASSGSPVAYAWDFGDGNTDTQANPTHTYSSDGTYTVCLTVTNAAGCDDTTCQSITIIGLEVSEQEESGISFYPNPANDVLNVLSIDPVQITIFNVIGEKVMSQRINSNGQISVKNLESGSYFIQFDQNGNRFTEKLIIK